MPDYLARVVARNMAPAQPVSPRVPSLFEPVVQTLVAGVPEIAPARPSAAGDQERSEQPAARRAEPARITHVPQPDRSTDEPPRADGVRASRPSRRRTPPGKAARTGQPADRAPASTRGERRADPPAAPRAAAPTRPQPTRPSPAAAVRHVQTAAVAPAPEPVRPGHPATPIARGGEPVPTAIEQARPARDRLESIADHVLTPNRTAAKLIAPATPRHSATEPGVDASAPRPPAPEAPATAPQALLAKRPAGQALVHVSIGRVEVRASADPPPTQPVRSRQQPPTALDDYLGRRNGTRR